MKDKFGNELKSGEFVIFINDKGITMVGQICQMDLSITHKGNISLIVGNRANHGIKPEDCVSVGAALAAITALNKK